jgi:hypothetical protein
MILKRFLLKKIRRKIGVFDSKTKPGKLCKKWIITLFFEKTLIFFRPKIVKNRRKFLKPNFLVLFGREAADKFVGSLGTN